jgi:hypothetical protein
LSWQPYSFWRPSRVYLDHLYTPGRPTATRGGQNGLYLYLRPQVNDVAFVFKKTVGSRGLCLLPSTFGKMEVKVEGTTFPQAWSLRIIDLSPWGVGGGGHRVQESFHLGQICDILTPASCPFWPHRFPHFGYIHLGGGGEGGSLTSLLSL